MRLISGAPGGSLPSEPGLRAIARWRGVKIVAGQHSAADTAIRRVVPGMLRRIQVVAVVVAG
jgi:hypothetical protein